MSYKVPFLHDVVLPEGRARWRDRSILVRVSDPEWQRFHKAAERLGMSLSDLLRQSALTVSCTEREVPDCDRPAVPMRDGGLLRVRSQPERHLAILLELLGCRWLYEPTTLWLSDGAGFVPDFAIDTPLGDCMVVTSDVKRIRPHDFLAEEVERLLGVPLFFLDSVDLVEVRKNVQAILDCHERKSGRPSLRALAWEAACAEMRLGDYVEKVRFALAEEEVGRRNGLVEEEIVWVDPLAKKLRYVREGTTLMPVPDLLVLATPSVWGHVHRVVAYAGVSGQGVRVRRYWYVLGGDPRPPAKTPRGVVDPRSIRARHPTRTI